MKEVHMGEMANNNTRVETGSKQNTHGRAMPHTKLAFRFCKFLYFLFLTLVCLPGI